MIIAIFGLSGSGKSVFAKKVADLTGFPIVEASQEFLKQHNSTRKDAHKLPIVRNVLEGCCVPTSAIVVGIRTIDELDHLRKISQVLGVKIQTSDEERVARVRSRDGITEEEFQKSDEFEAKLFELFPHELTKRDVQRIVVQTTCGDTKELTQILTWVKEQRVKNGTA